MKTEKEIKLFKIRLLEKLTSDNSYYGLSLESMALKN